MNQEVSKNAFRRFLSLATLLLILLAIGIAARLKGIAEGTEIIFTALASLGVLVNSWLGK
jgi:hypothetical protein